MKWLKRGVWGAIAGTALCLLFQTPAWAKSPLISGIEEAGEAEGPALEENQASESGEADSTVSTYTQEELDDNRIEYGELEDLIRTGNSQAINSLNSYQDSLAIYQAAYESLNSARYDMEYKAEDLEDEGGDESLISTYDQNASILASSAKQMKRSITSLNSRSNSWSRDQAVWTLVKTAQSLLVSCKEMESQTETARKQAEAAQAACDKTATMRTAGLATEAELLEAQKSLLAAQTSLQSTEDSYNRLMRQLAIMVGKDASSLELGDIPSVTEEELAGMNLEEDKPLMVIANSGVKSVKRTSATGDAERKLRRQQLEEAEGEASITVDEQYQEVAALALARDAAAAAFQAAEKDYNALQIRYTSGAINKGTFLTGEAQYLQSRAQLIAAEAELRAAYDAYQWMLKGV